MGEEVEESSSGRHQAANAWDVRVLPNVKSHMTGHRTPSPGGHGMRDHDDV